MDTLTLYKMGATGRANLAGLVTAGVEFYTGERDDRTGVVTLTPVKINAPGGTRTAADEVEAETPTGDAPWDDDDPEITLPQG